MGYSTTHPIRGTQPEQLIVAGTFRPNGSSAIAAANNKGFGWSVARTGTGVYTVTLDERLPDHVAFHVNARTTTTTHEILAQISAYSAANKTITIRTFRNVIAAGSAVTRRTAIPLDQCREVSTDILAFSDTEATAHVGGGGYMANDAAANWSLQRVNGATDKALILVQKAAVTTELQLPQLVVPADITTGGNISVSLWAKMNGSVGAASTLALTASVGIGDTVNTIAGAGALTTSWARYAYTITNAMITSGAGADAPTSMSLAIVPSAHASDALSIGGIYYDYDSQATEARIVEAYDMTSNADNEISFCAIGRNTLVNS